METIREISADDDASSLPEVDYTNFQATDVLDSFQQLRQEVRTEALARQFESEASGRCCHPPCSCSKCMKVCFLTSVIFLVCLALTVPSIYYVVIVVS